jgi:hypothetical protein
MCLDRRLMPRKARIFLAIGNVCLIMGIVMGNFDLRFHGNHSCWFDFARGFFLSMAIVFMYSAGRLARRCSPTGSPTR